MPVLRGQEMFTAKILMRIRQRNVAQLLNFLNKSQYWKYEQIREYQFKKLKSLLKYSYQNVPYYKKLFDEIGAKPQDIRKFKDFEAFPILTKEKINKNIQDMISSAVSNEDLIPNSTGGSTGEPLHFYQDIQYNNWADAARIRGWYHMAGCKAGVNCAVLWGAMKDIKQNYSFWERLKIFIEQGEIPLNAFNLSEEKKYEFLKWCKILRPKLLRGYFTAIKDFVIFLDKNNFNLKGLKGVVLCAETVDEKSRHHIEKVLKAPSYNMYGGRELSIVAMECLHQKGLHEVSENNYVEFKKNQLKGIENAGNLIITNLNNYAMPFIRYEIGDIGVESKESCECGRGLPLIKKIIGRTTEVFDFYDGTRIAGEMFIHLMKDFPVQEYQFIQVDNKTILLRLKRSNNIDEYLKEKIRLTYKDYLPENVQLNFEEVDSIEKTATGKFRFVLKQHE
ncbi:MAG: phenylacetate--CoA ligase family protein [Bacteroidales bacterium]|nr:phenylacetate--CoA ligase family protein [Bacteroidales bacterium]